MHEFSIAHNIVEMLVLAVQENKLQKVDTVTVEAGELRQIVPDSLQMAFDALKSEKEGCVEIKDCRLKLIIIPQKVICTDCYYEFHPEDLCYICPRCESINTEVQDGDRLIIRSIEGERE